MDRDSLLKQFTPDRPAERGFNFAGRREELGEIQGRAIQPLLDGKETPHFVFVRGERGIGKTSLARYFLEEQGGLCEYGERALVPVNVNLGFARSLDDVAAEVIWAFNQSDFLRAGFGNRVRQALSQVLDLGLNVGVFGTPITLELLRPRIPDVVEPARLADFLYNMVEKLTAIQEHIRGVLLVFDEVTRAFEDERVGRIGRQLSEGLMEKGSDVCPLLVMVCGDSKAVQSVHAHDEMRGMQAYGDVFALSSMGQDTIANFFYDHFDEVGVPIEEPVRDVLARMCGGSPYLMQLLAREVSRAYSSNGGPDTISWNIAFRGILNAQRFFVDRSPVIEQWSKKMSGADEVLRSLMLHIALENPTGPEIDFSQLYLNDAEEARLDGLTRDLIACGAADPTPDGRFSLRSVEIKWYTLLRSAPLIREQNRQL